jgi:sec-independent protein translocase protein TatA
MGPLGVQEMVVIFLVALVLFGPKKLPELGKTIAKAMGEFRRAQSELKATFDREMQSLEKETASFREVAHKASAEIASYSNMDLTGSPDGTYGSTHGTANAAVTNSSNVGASEISSAESHAELLNASYTDHILYGGSNEASLEVSQGFAPEIGLPQLGHAEGTVARGALPEYAGVDDVAESATPALKASPVAAAESNPLPELQTESAHGSHPENSPELPSLV